MDEGRDVGPIRELGWARANAPNQPGRSHGASANQGVLSVLSAWCPAPKYKKPVSPLELLTFGRLGSRAVREQGQGSPRGRIRWVSRPALKFSLTLRNLFIRNSRLPREVQ